MIEKIEGKMSAVLVNLATSEKLKEPDWSKNIEICELASRDPMEAKIVIKAIKKQLGSTDPNSQIFSVVLLEMLINNCGEHIHEMVIETGMLQLMVKIVKKKSDSPLREKIFLLLDAIQTAFGGASGKFPQYYKAYYELVRAEVQFPNHSTVPTSNLPNSRLQPKDLPVVATALQECDAVSEATNSQLIPDSSIIHKATTIMEVLREVLDAVDPLHPEGGATNEFTLDLVEQCSFQKQRVMHLVMTSRDEGLVSQAIELNDQLQKLLAKHDRLLSAPKASSIAVNNHEEAEDEEEADHLFRRDHKGKACAHAWREAPSESPSSSSDSISFERPPPPPTIGVCNTNWSPLRIEPREPACLQTPLVIPPPPAKQKERELFFKKQVVDPARVGENLGGLSLHGRHRSGSNSGSTELNE